jgi:poly(A) polymerase
MAASRLRLSNALRDRLAAAIAPGFDLGMTDAAARAAIYREGAAAFSDRVMKGWAERPAEEQDARRLRDLARDWRPPRFPLTGADVMAMGVERGPEVGRRLAAVEAQWIAGDFAEDHGALLRRLAAD